jgi:hypothetical protein
MVQIKMVVATSTNGMNSNRSADGDAALAGDSGEGPVPDSGGFSTLDSRRSTSDGSGETLAPGHGTLAGGETVDSDNSITAQVSQSWGAVR